MKTKQSLRWILKIVIISVVASMSFSLASNKLFEQAGYIMAFIILAMFIAVGVVFDAIGVAVTVAQEARFHSMATRRERGALESLRLIKNADKVACFCSDVVGDVTGITTGTIVTLMAVRLAEGLDAENLLIPLIISGIVTGLVIGGKAAGKMIAINKSTGIVLWVGKLMNILHLRKHNK
ncbi:MAG: hypothetical protein FWH57_01795 [Oscillospiraceae bacterium]|nr:hypothetical protein [Oscillospiraceae bacterium]